MTPPQRVFVVEGDHFAQHSYWRVIEERTECKSVGQCVFQRALDLRTFSIHTVPLVCLPLWTRTTLVMAYQ